MSSTPTPSKVLSSILGTKVTALSKHMEQIFQIALEKEFIDKCPTVHGPNHTRHLYRAIIVTDPTNSEFCKLLFPAVELYMLADVPLIAKDVYQHHFNELIIYMSYIFRKEPVRGNSYQALWAIAPDRDTWDPVPPAVQAGGH
jgi:hypothetical protein